MGLGLRRLENRQPGLWCLFWCPRQESNLYLSLRRTPFYPLNYEDKSGRNFTSSVELHRIDEVNAAGLPGLPAQREAVGEVVEDEERAQGAGQAAFVRHVEIPRETLSDGD